MENAGMIRLGIVGCGNVTQLRHLPALRRVSGVKVSAVSDINPARLDHVAGQFDAVRRYTDYRQLIEAGEVDAVAVCVPPQLHAEVTLAALEANKHVFIEKPLALSLEECDLLRACAARHVALKIMVGFNLRWHRLVRAARETIRRNELGEIKLVRSVFTSGVRLSDDFAEWRMRQQSGGGALFELGVHHFDLLRFLFEKDVEEIYASSLSEGETAIVAARLNGGTQVVSAFSEGTGENHEIEIYGERGWLRVSCYRADGLEQFGAAEYPDALMTRLRGLTRTLLKVPRMIRQSRRGGDYVASYEEEWRHFVGAITHDSPVASTLTDGRRALEIALAAWEANTTKRAIRLGQTAETCSKTVGAGTSPAPTIIIGRKSF
jgi:myo-inositol 2-dehydrogenase/D-chiro-inositol 1-dehydrogenase